jgi:hypothetical protein
MKLREIARMIDAEVDGGETGDAALDQEIRRVAKIEETGTSPSSQTRGISGTLNRPTRQR